MSELTALDIARLEEARQSKAVAAMMRLGAERIDPERYAVLELAGGSACYAGRGSWANQAMGLGLSGPVGDEELDALVDFYERRGCEPCIELCAHADESLVRGLSSRGFVLKEFENVLARSLSFDENLEALRRELPATMELEQVDLSDESRVDELGEAAMSGFLPEGKAMQESWVETNRLQALLPGSAAWVVRDDEGRAVAGSSMEANPGGAASLFGTSVRPPHRRKGLQSRLIVERLIHARDAGARVVTIHSSPHVATQANAARLGFRLAYAKTILVRPGEGLEPSP
jgi:GNAT superfamily N-acetyltransferase